MAKLDLIFQAVTSGNHATAVRKLLDLPDPTEVLVSVAFMRTGGLDKIETAIRPLASRSKFFVGIRNDITSIQAIKRLLAMKVSVYGVDTARRHSIFHPKLYFVANKNQARAIIGSANLTRGGLRNNIELSTRVELDLLDSADKLFADEISVALSNLAKAHPKHVFLIKTEKAADALFEEGRLADENERPAPAAAGRVRKGVRDALPPMDLIRAPEPKVKPIAASKPTKAVVKASAVAYEVWKSNPLKERDLCIPSGATTHPTGSMGWKKGAYDIDQRHYFRDEVFSELTWTPDAKPSKWERARADFRLVIKNLDYGEFSLQLSHNTDKKSRSYQQHNFMTHLNWGTARPEIAKRDLLGRTLYLYRKDTNPPSFVIEID